MKEEKINIDDLKRECLECGQEFIPDESGQECCDNECASVYYGWDEDENDGHEYDYDCDEEGI
jgi:hypothetical protein